MGQVFLFCCEAGIRQPDVDIQVYRKTLVSKLQRKGGLPTGMDQYRVYEPYVSPFDPCPPIKLKMYSTPPHLFIPFQPPNLPQFSPVEALKHGTLWPVLYSPYAGKL